MADSTLTAMTPATVATGGLFYGTQAGADRKFSLSGAGAAVAEAADASAQRGVLGLGSAALSASSAFATSAQGSTADAALPKAGTNTNNNASAGNIGEFVSSFVVEGSAVSLPNNAYTDITTISLTAGDWDVEGNVNFFESSATVTLRHAVINTSATDPGDGSECSLGAKTVLLSEENTITLPRKRFSLAATTTIHLVGRIGYTAGSAFGYGGITARRVR